MCLIVKAYNIPTRYEGLVRDAQQNSSHGQWRGGNRTEKGGSGGCGGSGGGGWNLGEELAAQEP